MTDILMTIDCFAFEEVQPIDNGPVIRIPFHNVRVPRGKVCRQETKRGIVIL